MSTTAINSEIARLESLRASQRETIETKLMMINFLEMMGKITDEQKQKKEVVENFYKCSDTHITHKIKFWTQYKTGEMEADMLTKMNETMTEWIESGWAYLGMEDFKEQSDNVKDEYNMFKVMFERCKIKEPVKKKTRRGGKKHKKKNKD
jgi:hypothetical protein